jgi:5-methylcytosine-specific restriction endonuclease McrBC regulatory subunit McrC
LLLFRNQGRAGADGLDDLPAGFVLDMASLFERYVRALFVDCLSASAVPYKRTLVYQLDGLRSSIELDGLLELPTRRIVIECKYRRMIDSLGAIMMERWSNAHVYQAVAYAAHRDVFAEDALIVFPHVGLSEPVLEHVSTGSFARAGKGVRLRIWSISIDKPAAQTAAALALRAKALIA